MILGIGNDLVDIRRVGHSIERFGDRFLARVFTEEERRVADRREGGPGSRNSRVSAYAKRFAAKEACSKALGTGIDQGVGWRDMGVINPPSGRPYLELTDGAARRLADLTPAGMVPVVHLTMADEYPLAQAVVVISADPIATARNGNP